VSQTKVAGQTATAPAALQNPFSMTIGGSNASVVYAGLSPGPMGVYQFNVVVPANVSTGDVPVRFALNATAAELQTLAVAAKGAAINLPGLVGTAGSGGANIAFMAPVSNGGAAITRYTAICAGIGGSSSANGAASPIAVTGLTNGITYGCTETATNPAGVGPASAAITVTPAAASIGARSRIRFGYR